MIAQLASFTALLFLLCQFAFGQVEENQVDFTISPSVLQSGEIHIAFEWLRPSEFKQKDLAIIDIPKISALHPGNNQIVASKLAFISKKSFDELSYQKMNQADFISSMLNSVSVTQKAPSKWYVVNKVKAYGLPFKMNFELNFTETLPAVVPAPVATYLRDEASAIKTKGRETFLVLDMVNFSQLMYRNYSYVYIKEIGPKETLVVGVVIAGLNLSKANSYFNYPPISYTQRTMMKNMRTQILQMAYEIQE